MTPSPWLLLALADHVRALEVRAAVAERRQHEAERRRRIAEEAAALDAQVVGAIASVHGGRVTVSRAVLERGPWHVERQERLEGVAITSRPIR